MRLLFTTGEPELLPTASEPQLLVLFFERQRFRNLNLHCLEFTRTGIMVCCLVFKVKSVGRFVHIELLYAYIFGDCCFFIRKILYEFTVVLLFDMMLIVVVSFYCLLGLIVIICFEFTDFGFLL